MSKITLDQIREECKKNNWQCVSDTYINLKTEMIFKCEEGHTVTNTWEKIRKKFVCPICKENIKKDISQISALPKTSKHRILALDQSSHTTGYSIYDDDELISYGIYSTNKSQLNDRMKDTCDWLNSMIYTWKPDEVVLEETLYNANFEKEKENAIRNHDVFRMLTQVMGALMITILRTNCKLTIVKIATWRHHVGVKGRTRVDQKRSAQFLVKKWYDISVTDDESDAICIGKYAADIAISNKKNVIGDLEW